MLKGVIDDAAVDKRGMGSGCGGLMEVSFGSEVGMGWEVVWRVVNLRFVDG